MTTNPASPPHDVRVKLSRLLESETHDEKLTRVLIDTYIEYTTQFPEEAVALHATIAATLEEHVTSQPVCHAAIQLLRNDRGNLFPDHFALAVSAAIRTTSHSLERGNAFHAILLALEVPVLRDASFEACQSILRAPSQNLPQRELREFARELISFFRRSRFEHPLRDDVKTFAHNVFTVGQSVATPTEHQPSAMNLPDQNDATRGEVARVLLKLFMQRPPQSTLDRLTGEDFRHLGALSGLTIEEFKTTAEILAQYASRDGSALDAFLRVAKSPHEPAVSVQTRTQVLASLLATARRRGGLSHNVERQILATAAEIPELPFIRNADASEVPVD